MSLYGALFSGVSGLQAQSSAMGAIADNVTNVNTIGYKGTKVNFQTLITKQVSLTQYSAGGVQSKPRQGVDIQGLLQSTSSATDVAISGQGFFLVNEAAEPTTGDTYGYTRAGSFKVDKEGFLQNVGGFYMQGWPLQTWDSNALAAQVQIGNNTYMKSYTNSSGGTVYMNDNIVDSTNLRPLNLNTIGGTASNTTTLSFGANLPADKALGGTEQANMLIYDTLGNAHNLDFTYINRATNTWDLETMPPKGANQLTLKDQSGDVYYSNGRLDFTGTPAAGSTLHFTMYNEVANASQSYHISFSTAADDSAVTTGVLASGNLMNIQTTGRTLSQMLDQLATSINNLMGTIDNVASINTSSGKWAERLSGESSIVIRQFTSNGGIVVDSTDILDSSSNTSVTQGSATYTITALNATDGYLAADSSATTTTTRRYVNFNGDGTPNTFFGKDETVAADPRGSIAIDWANGSTDMDGSNKPEISLFQGNYNLADGLTQFSGNYQINYISQNGAKIGNYAGVSIGADGIVTALFDNGVTIPVFMIPVATFVNPNAMENVTGNMWIETDFSGQPTVREPGDGGAGSTNAAALEASTVDLGQEFTDMITTQRAYSASAKIISTSDEMLEELLRIKR